MVECEICRTISVLGAGTGAEAYAHHGETPDQTEPRGRLEEIIKTMERSLSWGRGSRLLDVKHGHAPPFQELACERGWEAAEASRPEVERLADDFNDALVNLSFDAVTMWHTLETAPDPHRLVRGAASLLRAGGVLFGRTVNSSAWSLRLFGAEWQYMRPPDQLFWFHPSHLELLLEEHGFDICFTRTRFSGLAFASGCLGKRASRLAKAGVAGCALWTIGRLAERHTAGDVVEFLAQKRGFVVS